jgi:hypothetical protein
MTVFNNPHMLGFDHFERILDRAAKASAEGYPPYNIEQTGENDLRITLAVAGFTMNDLTVSIEDNQLVANKSMMGPIVFLSIAGSPPGNSNAVLFWPKGSTWWVPHWTTDC